MYCVGFGLFVLAFGNLNNGTGNGGLSYLNGNNALSNTNWNILSRLSQNCLKILLHYIILTAVKIGSRTNGLVGKRKSVLTKKGK